MNSPEYKEKLLNNIPNIQYILDLLAQTDWYLSNEDDKKVFAQNSFVFIHSNFDSINRTDLINIMDRLCYFDINNEDLAKNLMRKSIEFGLPLLTPYHANFDIFSNDEKIAYVKILNNTNNDDFYFFNLKLSKINPELLFDIYKNNYYSDKNELEDKEFACENLNLLILDSKPALFFKNMLIDKNEKIRLLKKSLNKENSSPNFWPIFQIIKNNEIDLTTFELIIEPIANKLANPQGFYNKKNNVIDFFDILSKKDKSLREEASKVILNFPEIKKGFISILKEKIKLPKDYDIKDFKNNIQNYSNINLLQYLLLNNRNSFLTDLCKKDKDFMGLFNNSLLQRVSEFDYERNPLDLALQGHILPSAIEDIYIYKTLNNELNPRTKDKVCALFFKSISTCIASDPIYNSLLNAVSLMPTNLVNKYFNRYKEVLSEKKHDDLETIRNMLNLNKSLAVKDNSEESKIKPRTKI